MRLGFGLLALALLAGCSEDKAARLAAAWKCGPIEGIKAISGDKPPEWTLVGEFTETTEAPAAFAEIACNLATTVQAGEKLFVGVSSYFGGQTAAEAAMEARLKSLAEAGAPIVLKEIGVEDHPYSIHERSKTEKAWAANLTRMVADAGASHALLLVSRVDATNAAIPPAGDRFAGYSPMPTFLEGRVVTLDVATNPIAGASGPVIRIARAPQNGFDGQLALASLTKPSLALDLNHGRAAVALTPDEPPVPSAEELKKQAADEILRDAQARIDSIITNGELRATIRTEEDILKHLDDHLPEFQPE